MTLLLAIFSLLSVPQQQEEELELIFVVDSSNSMKRNDPNGLRTQISGAMVDFLGRNRPVKASVVQFAGWNESQKKKIVLLSRSGDLTEVTTSLKNLPAFGDASDINVAFEIAIPKILNARKAAGTEGPLWIIVLTDGEFDVIEESDIRPVYQEMAEKEFADLYEEEPDVALNRAALKILFETLRTQYSEIPLILSGINLGKEKVDQESTFHKLVTLGGSRKGKVLQVENSVLQDIVVPLLGQDPGADKKRETFYGYRPSGEKESPFHLYPGSREATILTWGITSAYSVKSPGIDFQQSGEGTSYRLISFPTETSGDFPLEVEGSEVEMIFHIATDLTPVLKRTGEGNLGRNDNFTAEITIQNKKGAIASSPQLTKALSGSARLTPSAGADKTTPLQFIAQSRSLYEEPVSSVSGNGRFLLDCDVTMNLPGAQNTLSLGPSTDSIEFLVLPTFTISFEKVKTWIGQSNTVRVTPAPVAPIEVTLEGPDSPTLTIGTTGTATLEPGIAGTWSIKEKNYNTFFLKAGETSTTTIQERKIRVLQNGKLVDAISADIRFEEKATYALEIEIDVDRDEEEKATFSFLFEGEEGIRLTRKDGKVFLDIHTLADLPDKIGTAQIVATVSGSNISADRPVTIRYTDRTAKLFQKFLPYILAAIVAILFLTAFMLLHRFEERQLWVYKQGDIILASHLRDWKKGVAGRKAFGTEEKEKTLLFRMKGMKGGGKAACTLENIGEPDIYHSLKKMEKKEKRALSHGEEILLSAGLEEWHYFFFDRTPTDEELLSRKMQLEEEDELFLEDE